MAWCSSLRSSDVPLGPDWSGRAGESAIVQTHPRLELVVQRDGDRLADAAVLVDGGVIGELEGRAAHGGACAAVRLDAAVGTAAGQRQVVRAAVRAVVRLV